MSFVIAENCPKWITLDLLQKILQGDEEETTELNQVTIYQIKADPAVAKGENFNSDLTRISVKYTKGHKKGFKFAFFIFKSELIQDPQQDIFYIFQREEACYQKVLPRVYGLLKCIGEESCKLSPECVTVNNTAQPRYFVFEDLRHLGYANADRKLGLDVPHLELAMKKLAIWHATTAHLAQVDPTTMDQHKFPNVSKDVTNYHPFFEGAVRFAAETIRTWSGCEHLGEKLYQLANQIIERNCGVFIRDPNAFNVLIHGDMWISNILFKNDPDGHPVDAVFVDYSVGFYGSPGVDLSYLLFTSSRETNTEGHWDALLRVYHNELVATLKRLGFTGKIPTMLDIYVEYLRKSYYGLMISTFLIPLRLIDETANSDLHNLLGDQPENVAFKKMLFETPKYRAFMEPLLKFWDSKGLLDVDV